MILKFSPIEHIFLLSIYHLIQQIPAWPPCLMSYDQTRSCISHLRLYQQVHPRRSSSGELCSCFRWGPSSGHSFRRRRGCYYQYQRQIYSIKCHMESPVCRTRVQAGKGGFLLISWDRITILQESIVKQIHLTSNYQLGLWPCGCVGRRRCSWNGCASRRCTEHKLRRCVPFACRCWWWTEALVWLSGNPEAVGASPSQLSWRTS